jgi:hypothetical protein
MALSTTQSIWRSGGGDQTRTAYCGSGIMGAQFYIADASTGPATNVKISSTAGAPNLILPAGAVVVAVAINAAGAGSIDLGTVGYTTGTPSAQSIANNLSVATVGTVTAGVTNNATSEMAYVTSKIDTGGSGAISGYLLYFVADPLVGQQNV